MEYKKIDNTYVVKLLPGDEVMASMKAIITKENIKFGKVEGIGRVKDVTLSYLPGRDHIKKEFKGAFELVTLLGSVLSPERIHLHAIIAHDKTLNLTGGHLFKAAVEDDKIVELFITTFDTNIKTKWEGNIPFATWDFGV